MPASAEFTLIWPVAAQATFAPLVGSTAARPYTAAPFSVVNDPPITTFDPSGVSSIVRTTPFAGGAHGSSEPAVVNAAVLVRGDDPPVMNPAEVKPPPTYTVDAVGTIVSGVPPRVGRQEKSIDPDARSNRTMWNASKPFAFVKSPPTYSFDASGDSATERPAPLSDKARGTRSPVRML